MSSLTDLLGRANFKNTFGFSLSREEAEAIAEEYGEPEESGSDSYVDDGGYAETIDSSNSDEGEVVTSEELSTDLIATQDEATEVENIDENIDQLEEVSVATEAFIDNILFCRETGAANIAVGNMWEKHLSLLSTAYKLPSELLPAINHGYEGYSSATAATISTESVFDSIKDFFVKIIDMIIQGVAWLIDKGAQFISKLFNNVNKMKSYAERLKKDVNRINDSKPLDKDDAKYKSAGHAIALMVEGKLVKPAEAAKLIADEAYYLSQKWGVQSIGDVGHQSLVHAITDIQNGSNVDVSDDDFKSNMEARAKETDEQLKAIKENKKLSGIKSYAPGNLNKFKEFFNKMISDMAHKVPYGDKLTEVSTSKMKDYGCPAIPGARMAHGNILPRNKVIVTFRTRSVTQTDHSDFDSKVDKGEAQFKMFSKLNNYKGANGNKTNEREFDVMAKNDMLAAITQIEKALINIERLKTLMDKIKPVASKIGGLAKKVRMNYLSVTSRQRNGKKFMANIRQTRATVQMCRTCVNLLREPGTGFITYALFEVKSLLDIVKYSMNRYDMNDEKDEGN